MSRIERVKITWLWIIAYTSPECLGLELTRRLDQHDCYSLASII